MAIPSPEIDARNSLLIAERNAAFTHAAIATGSPTLWEAVGLPSGFAINASTGVITGTPSAAGVFPFILKASNFDARNFTADASANTVTSPGSALQDGDLVTLETTGTLPAPLTTLDTYEVRDSAAGGVMKLAATVGGAAIDITSTGSGTHTIKKKQTAEASVLLAVMGSTSTVEPGDIAIEIDVDIVTGKVTVLGAEGAEFGPPITEPRQEGKRKAILAAKSGDRFPVAVGFKRGGTLQDLSVTSLKIGAKEFAPDALISLTPGTFSKIGSGASTRYKVDLIFSDAAWRGVLSNYEGDNDIYLDALAEIRAELEAGDGTAVDETLVETLSPALTGGTSQVDSFVFEDLPQNGGAVAYALEANLAFPGRATQNVSLDRAFALTWNGSSFVVTNATGSTSGQGADESALGKWRSTLAINSITGNAEGVTVATTTSASTVTGEALIIPLADFEVDGAEIVDLDGEGQIRWNPGPYDPDTYSLAIVTSPGGGVSIPFENFDTAFSLEAEIAANLSVNPDLSAITGVFIDVATQSIIFLLEEGHGIVSSETAANGNHQTPSSLSSESQAGTVTLILTASEAGASYRKTSETFILRTEKHLVEPVSV